MTRPGRDPTEPGCAAIDRRDEGGDPACWAHRVCPQCGRFNEAEPPLRCDACGATLPA